MNTTMIAIGMASVMICIGMVLRSKIGFLKKMLMPVSVIAGVLGFIFMNTIGNDLIDGVNVKMFSDIVDVLFTISFISIGLSSGTGKKKDKKEKKEKGEKNTQSGSVSGAIGMGLIWCLLYAITGAIGVIVIALTGKAVDMDAIYGILIPFGFCQGPGQASTYGRLFEYTYGFQNAEMVSLTFAVIGFLAAFGIGVPLAKYGLKKGLAKNKSRISGAVERGYFTKEEQRESMGKVTTHAGNIETLSIHVALIGISYLLAVVMAQIITLIPFLGETFGAMLFFWGMLAGNLVKSILGKLGIDYIVNNQLQSKITGWTSDFLVVCAFMGIQVGVIGTWIVPIIIECIVVALVTFVICIYFGSRLGSDHDFERILGLYGTATGTTPSGIALVRMVDPKLDTPTTNELGLMNMAMLFSTPTMIVITLVGLQTISLPVAVILLFATCLLYLILLKVFKVWRKPSFSIFSGTKHEVSEAGELGSVATLVQGFLRTEVEDNAGIYK